MQDPMTPDLMDLTASSTPASGVNLAALSAALQGLNAAPEQSKIGQNMSQIGQGLMAKPIAPNQMAGQVVARVSPLQGVANGLQNYLAMNKIGQGIQQQQQAAASQAQGRSAVQAMLAQMLRGQQPSADQQLSQQAAQVPGQMSGGETQSPYSSFGTDPSTWQPHASAGSDLAPGASLQEVTPTASSVDLRKILQSGGSPLTDDGSSDDDIYAALLGQ